MNKLIELVTHRADDIQMVLFLTTVLLCWVVENLVGLSSGYQKRKHAFLNSKFLAINVPVQLFFGAAMVATILWTSSHHFGILYCLPFIRNHFILFLIGFILLDFGE